MLDTLMTAVFLRPTIDIVQTNRPFVKFQDDKNISMEEHMNRFGNEANRTLVGYIPDESWPSIFEIL